MPSNYNGRGGPKKQDGKIADKFRDACPPHKAKDLDALVKLCKGDEAKIQAKITEWWDEPQIEEPQWESVGKANKKTVEKKDRGGDRGDRGGLRGDVRDRGGLSGGGSGGGRRGDRFSDRGGRDGPRRDGRGGRGGRFGDRDRNRGGDRGPKSTPSSAPAPTPAPKPKKEQGGPSPVTNIPGPKGAWGAQSFAAAAAASSAPKAPLPAAPAAPTPVTPAPAVHEPKEPEFTPAMEPEEEIPVDLGGPAVNMISPEDPTPSGLPTPTAPLAPPVATGNVWGTKGGAHLIQAAKKPPAPPAPAAPISLAPEVEVEPELESDEEPEVVPEEATPLPMVEEPLPEPEPEPETALEPEETLVKESSFGVSLDSVLPPSVNGANINASGWEPILDQPADSSQQQQQQPSVDISHPSPVGAISVGTAPSMQEPEPVSLPKPLAQEVSSPPATVSQPPAAGGKPSSVLNMGHWETGEGDDDLDFGFGSFGAPENDTEATIAETSSASANASSAPSSSSQVVPPPPSTTTAESSLPSTATSAAPPATTHASPARPPPGLSMPPMPAGAMLVHELEGKLDSTSIGPKADNAPVTEKVTPSAPSASQPQSFNAVNEFSGQMNPPGMSQYGGMGMYNIPPPGVPNGLGSMPPGHFHLDSGMNNQQSDSRPGNPPTQLNQTSQQQQYGMQQTTSGISNNSAGAPSNDAPGSAPGAPGNNNAPGMPPGMPSMQYPNAAYMYAAGVAGQFNQMGHPAYGMQAAAYGYGQQFAPQGGHQFGGYNQGLMGQGGGYGAPSHYDDQRRGGGGSNMRDHQGGGYNKGGRGGGYRGNRSHHPNTHGSGYGNNYQANPNIGGYGAGPYSMGGYGHGGGYGNPGGPSGMDHYGMQQQQQQQGGGGGYGGFSHQDNDHNKKSSGPHGGQGGGAGGFQQQSHLHQQPLGLQGSSADTGTGGGASGGWPGSRQQNWGGNWQQEN